MRRKRRCDRLGDILAAMRVLRLRMLNSMEPIGILLRKSDCALLRDLGNSLWENGSLAESWQHMRQNAKGSDVLIYLQQEELQALDGFFQSLGRSGREEQSQLFSSVIGLLEEYQQQARRHYQETGKLCTTLGTLAGIAICVLIA